MSRRMHLKEVWSHQKKLSNLHGDTSKVWIRMIFNGTSTQIGHFVPSCHAGLLTHGKPTKNNALYLQNYPRVVKKRQPTCNNLIIDFTSYLLNYVPAPSPSSQCHTSYYTQPVQFTSLHAAVFHEQNILKSDNFSGLVFKTRDYIKYIK